MTKRYAMMIMQIHEETIFEVRAPTYPDRPIAFRHYPVGWWVSHPVLEFVGRVKTSDERTTKIVNGSVHHTYDLVSCTARQVAALESCPLIVGK